MSIKLNYKGQSQKHVKFFKDVLEILFSYSDDYWIDKNQKYKV